METTSNIFGAVVHYVYTWLPKTPARSNKKLAAVGRRRKENGLRVLRRKHQIISIESTVHCPFTPAVSTSALFYNHAQEECRRIEDVAQSFCISNFEVVGYRFLSTEKKLCKRSALKRWIRQRTSVEPVGQTPVRVGRHDACTKLLFEVTAKTEGDSLVCTQAPCNYGGLRGRGKRPSWRRQIVQED